MHFHPQQGEERIPQTEVLVEEVVVEGLRGEGPERRQCLIPCSGKVLFLNAGERTSALKHDSLGPESTTRGRIGLCIFIWICLFLP